MRELLEQAIRDEHDLLARQIRYHVIKVFTSRNAGTAVGEAMHRRQIEELLDQYARERNHQT